MSYCGRFAPSPSGRLHLGSLVTAYASYFRALSCQGKFIIRIEDLDFPRCPPENTPIMLQELELLGLKSSCQPIIQSEQLEVYNQALSTLIGQGKAYYCQCTRALIKQRPCPCALPKIQEQIQQGALDHVAIRMDLSAYLKHHPSFVDGNLGLIEQSALDHELAHSLVLKRADDIIAYNLAVVLDDHNEGITEVVRGADMLDATFLQLCLYEILGFTAPKFFHVALITDRSGLKFSKQNKAPAVLTYSSPHQALLHTVKLLGQTQVQEELILTLDKLYGALAQLVSPVLESLCAKHASELSVYELVNGYLSSCNATYPSTEGVVSLQDLCERHKSELIAPRLLGKTILESQTEANLYIGQQLALEYQHFHAALLEALTQSFNAQNMPNSPIVI